MASVGKFVGHSRRHCLRKPEPEWVKNRHRPESSAAQTQTEEKMKIVIEDKCDRVWSVVASLRYHASVGLKSDKQRLDALLKSNP
jgi:hypothetical protein